MGTGQEIELIFVSATQGTFKTTYTRNDGAVVLIEGEFLVELQY